VRHRVAGSDRDGVNARQVREYKDRTIRPLAGIQILRAVAALGVVIHHMQSELIQRGFDNPFPDFEVGAFGVDLFFVISGFIMVYSSGRFFARPDGGRRFFLKRLIRIVPLYWLFTTLLVFIAIRGTWHTGAYSVKEFIASYLFIPAPDRLGLMIPTYPPGWTLNYEMFFYVCFASALRWSRPIAVSLVVSALTALVILGYMVALPQPIAFWTDSLCLEFCYGIGLALLFLRGWRIRPLVRLALLITGAIAAVAFVAQGESSPIRGFAWGLPAASIVAAAALTDASLRSRFARAFESLGDASYSLYLIHVLLFILLYPVVAKIIDPLRLSGAVYGSTLVGASVAAALALYAWVELPMTRYFTGLYGVAVPRSRSV
jgi:exopolysaccharide production protein ExoZ